MSAPVDNIDKYREPVDEHQPVKRFSEHIVLVTIVVLSLLVGVMTTISSRKMFFDAGLDHQFYGILIFWGLMPGAVTFAFLADVYGRKPVFIVFAAASIITPLLFLSSNPSLILIGFTLHTVSKGGHLTIAYVAITEYCNTKHRFAYLIAANSAMTTMPSLILGLLYNYVIPVESVYVQVLVTVLGLSCLVSACLWPESPYWLAARDRRADAAWTLQRLRGAGAEPELSQLQNERRSPGPKRLYFRPLLIVIIAALIAKLNELLDFFETSKIISNFDNKTRDLTNWVIPTLVIPCLVLITVISYFVKRKTLYVSSCAVAMVIIFIIGIWMCSASTEHVVYTALVLISAIVRACTVRSMSVIIYTEIVPYKYNTHISCVRFLFVMVVAILEMLVFSSIGIGDYAYIMVMLIAILSSVGIGLVYWLAPETKGLTLFEIQKTQAPQYNVTFPEQNETMMENIQR